MLNGCTMQYFEVYFDQFHWFISNPCPSKIQKRGYSAVYCICCLAFGFKHLLLTILLATENTSRCENTSRIKCGSKIKISHLHFDRWNVPDLALQDSGSDICSGLNFLSLTNQQLDKNWIMQSWCGGVLDFLFPQLNKNFAPGQNKTQTYSKRGLRQEITPHLSTSY